MGLANKLFLFIGGTLLALLLLVFLVLQDIQARQWEEHLREQSLSFARFATPELLKLFRGDFTAQGSHDLRAVEDFLGFNPDLVEFSIYSTNGRALFTSPRFPEYIDLEDLAVDSAELQQRLAALRPTQATVRLAGGGRLLDVLVPAFGPTGQHLVSVRYLVSYAGIDRRLEQSRASFLQLMLVVAAVSLLLVAMVARGIARPVRTLTQGALAIAEGDLDTRIRVGGRDELGELARAFNTMASSLASHRAELLDVQQQLLRNERLAAVGQMAAGISHEIDNPVGVMLGYAELLMEDFAADDPRREDVQAIIDECRRCKRITGGLLNLARHREGERRRLDLAELATAIVDSLQPQPLFRGVVLHVAGENHVPVAGDADQLRQILINLLLNAAQALEGQGKIDVQLFRDEEYGAIEVRDNGPGIPAELRERIFDPFFTTKPGGEGTGLGLAICRRLVEDHGGRLLLLETPGGAAFRLEIPRLVEEKSFDKDSGSSLG